MVKSLALKVQDISFESGERLPLLVDTASGIPDFESTQYILTQQRPRNLSASTLRSITRAIMFGYQVLELMGVDIDERIAYRSLFSLEEINELAYHFRQSQEVLRGRLAASSQKSLIASIRKGTSGFHAPGDAVTVDSAAIRLIYFKGFVDWKVKKTLLGNASKEGADTLWKALQSFVQSIEVRMPKKSHKGDLELPEGLSKEEVQVLLELIDPASQNNPWKSAAIKTRNRLVVSLLIATGMRKGELLGIKVHDIDFKANEITVHRRADDAEDTRVIQPNAKTRARVLKISSQLAREVHQYLVKHREEAQRARHHPFLFVSNGNGNPLSISAIDRLFNDLLAASFGRISKLSPHLLRHTWNDRFSELMDEKGMEENKEMDARSYQMGWAPGSGTAKTYTRRHIRKRANDASLVLQSRITGNKNAEK